MSQCKGIAASTGQRCKKTSADDFCHLHKGQASSAARAPSGGSPGKLQHSPAGGSSAAQCQGVTVKGEPCRNSGGVGGFCHHHVDQVRVAPAEQRSEPARALPAVGGEPASRSAHPADLCQGLTSKGLLYSAATLVARAATATTTWTRRCP